MSQVWNVTTQKEEQKKFLNTGTDHLTYLSRKKRKSNFPFFSTKSFTLFSVSFFFSKKLLVLLIYLYDDVSTSVIYTLLVQANFHVCFPVLSRHKSTLAWTPIIIKIYLKMVKVINIAYGFLESRTWVSRINLEAYRNSFGWWWGGGAWL